MSGWAENHNSYMNHNSNMMNDFSQLFQKKKKLSGKLPHADTNSFLVPTCAICQDCKDQIIVLSFLYFKTQLVCVHSF